MVDLQKRTLDEGRRWLAGDDARRHRHDAVEDARRRLDAANLRLATLQQETDALVQAVSLLQAEFAASRRSTPATDPLALATAAKHEAAASAAVQDLRHRHAYNLGQLSQAQTEQRQAQAALNAQLEAAAFNVPEIRDLRDRIAALAGNPAPGARQRLAAARAELARAERQADAQYQSIVAATTRQEGTDR